MCELCDEARGLLRKDKELLEWRGERVLNLPSGVRVRLNLLRFKEDPNKPPFETPPPPNGMKLWAMHEESKFFDVGYFYTPYVPYG